MPINIPETTQKRIVIIGAGFGGLKLARTLSGSDYQVVLIDKNNYHQFQPLYYQVATAGLEPSAISFPLRKIFQNQNNIIIRVAELLKVDSTNNQIDTSLGIVNYDFLVLAIGTTSNFFNLTNIEAHALTMKSVSEALTLRNRMLNNFEKALMATGEEKAALLNIVIVGGGPTGTEISGTIADMRNKILPKDYPELDFKEMNIYLVEASPNTLNVMSPISSKKSREYLERLGVIVMTSTQVKNFDNNIVSLGDGSTIKTNTLIWAAGVIVPKIEGINPSIIVRGNRLKVDSFNKVEGYENIYALGDMASMADIRWDKGHPQLAQPAIQQGTNLGRNFIARLKGKKETPFVYKDLGSMATIGRNLAVVDLPYIKFQGFFAWLAWMLVHLMSIVGVKNRLLIFINWVWNYFTYDQSLRLILKPSKEKD